MTELVNNKNNRINFDIPSINGILLFRESSKFLVVHGSRILQKVPTTNPYKEKYKGIYYCLIICQRMLQGNYCNYGIFDLYHDPTLNDLMDITVKLALAVPLSELLVIKKNIF